MNKNNHYFEIIVGTFVLLCATYFFFNSFKSAKVGRVSGYYVIAKFDNIDGIAGGSDVKISGVKIGTVEDQYLDSEDFRATLRLSIDQGIKLPTDSSAKISSEGLLGSKYLSITPGADEEMLKNGDEIQFTQSSINFEDLLGKFIFSSADKDKNSNKDKNSENEKK
jgi:phospholipid/cholesterol/gamma-HCH transport system substrate-binding protein